MNHSNKSSYFELLKKYNSQSEIPYYELLQTKEWFDKRKSILKRDGNCCTKCKRTETEYFDGIGYWWLSNEERIEKVVLKDESIETEIKHEVILSERSDKPYHLHVHHHYYILSNLPWEYPDEALVTICNWCHWSFHLENKVPVYETNQMQINLNFKPCARCNGTGWFQEYKHVESGFNIFLGNSIPADN